ncbi:plasma membrane H+-ATPase [Sulfuriferula multivorans]|uniref:Plasma membrane H+-ATPase n=1 Tax=Sulfuriferula multivorans TaxID=1559896 RepID=A0A401JAG4_9PROT|nr:hypothetical protein [Sulfuriferula multivorans]GBL44554.1 plasma membrane H+-ATPase [Sulfuriferula multivorans]
MQTLIYVMLVFTGQDNVYLVRERRHFWQSRPGCWLVLVSVPDIVLMSVLATRGILMTATSPALVGGAAGFVVSGSGGFPEDTHLQVFFFF